MATASGKTVTALIAAHRLWQAMGEALIVIAAPSLPLIAQWQGEAKEFGLSAIVLAGARASKVRAAASTIRRLNLGTQSVGCLIVTNHMLGDDAFQTELRKHTGATLLIADEAHNLGSAGALDRLPLHIPSRLALSATPIRQYDPDGTDGLLAYFGQIVYRFGLREAIGLCLVPYDYYVHPVRLSQDEADEWSSLTAQLQRHSWRRQAEDVDQRPLQALLTRRRRVLETAGGKIDALRRRLAPLNRHDIRHTLVYATDKEPRQLEQVNSLLIELGIRHHQLTDAETDDPQRVARIVAAFREGEIQVLTAKRVLDEGVNIPEISSAYILASTTVERQWVQRRGRVLRKCDAIGKTHAEIHDFATLPPQSAARDAEARHLLRAELDRMSEFAKLARNSGMVGGPRELIERIVLDYFA